MVFPVTLRFSPLLLALVALPAPAQIVPDSGQILQQVQPHAPMQPPRNPKLTVEQPTTASSASSVRFQVNHIVVVGTSAADPSTLHALVAADEGRKLTLAQLQKLAARITAWYHAHGYPLARAIVPAQTLHHGILRIQVAEARYDRIVMHNTSRVGNALVRATLGTLRPGQVVKQAPLDRALLLLGDLPGVDAHATLRSGRHPGTTQLNVVAAPEPLLDGDVYLDNSGSHYTGRLRAGVNLNLNSPAHHGDLLSLSALSTGKGLDYGRAAYQSTLNGAGTGLGASYSALHYMLSGGTVSQLDAHGAARVTSVWLAQPLVRSPHASLYARLEFDRKRLRDDIDATALHDRRHINSWTLDLYGQHQDSWLGGGITHVGVGVTHGTLRFDDAIIAATDAVTAHRQGDYTRWNAHLSRLQQLGAGLHLQVRLRGQGSSDNLDSSERFLLGGPDSLPGYEAVSASGSSGWLAGVALGRALDWGCLGRCQGQIFLDTGAVRVNAEPWTPGSNHERRGDAGIGFDWTGTQQWLLHLQLAVPVGPAVEGVHQGMQFWMRLSKGFQCECF